MLPLWAVAVRVRDFQLRHQPVGRLVMVAKVPVARQDQPPPRKITGAIR
ncbi:MAG: hypothetical protein IH899_06560 [Planctomycetes bacterium]|nr:hypothetical protein [Planctomycetota bacterium]